MRTYLVTGGAGFIGSNFIHYLLEEHDDIKIINLDKLTYAGNLANLKSIEKDSRYSFIHGDIADGKLVASLLKKKVDVIVNFAAETHVDRSIMDPTAFIKTDIFGTYELLEQARIHGVDCFLQISTDEVYGSIEVGSCNEEAPLKPRNPYSASKAGADRLAYSYWATYKLPVIITRCSNNFGFYQYPEKLISLAITNLLEGKNVPVYGDGKNIRDWIFVKDHCRAVQFCIEHGRLGEVYNVAGRCEQFNIDIVKKIIKILSLDEGRIEFVKDRLGHDRRYSLDDSKLRNLGWNSQHTFDDSLGATVAWYNQNASWWSPIKTGQYLDYYKAQYLNR